MGFSLKRTPPSGYIQAIVTSDNLVVCDTHFWHGRTTPCERIANDEGATIDDSPCQACTEKIGYRTHAYVACFDPKKQEHCLFECTTHAAKSLAEYHEANGTLRGCILRASRPTGKPNGQVTIETNTANLAKVHLPTAPSIQLALAVIWRLPAAALPTTNERDLSPMDDGKRPVRQTTIRPDPVPLRRQRQQSDNEPDPPTMTEILQGNGKK